MATTKNIGQILVDKAKELDPTYQPDKFNDMGEAAQIILDNMGAKFEEVNELPKEGNAGTIYLLPTEGGSSSGGSGGGGSSSGIDPNMRMIHTLDFRVPIGNNSIGHGGIVVRTYVDNWGLNYFKDLLIQAVGDEMGSAPATWENISHYVGEIYKAAASERKVGWCLTIIGVLVDLGSMTCGLTIPAPEGAKTYDLCPIIIHDDKPQVFISTNEQGSASLKDLTELIAAYDGSETASIAVDEMWG